MRAAFYEYAAGERRSEDVLGGAVKELDPLRCRHFPLVLLESFIKLTSLSKHPLKKTPSIKFSFPLFELTSASASVSWDCVVCVSRSPNQSDYNTVCLTVQLLSAHQYWDHWYQGGEERITCTSLRLVSFKRTRYHPFQNKSVVQSNCRGNLCTIF